MKIIFILLFCLSLAAKEKKEKNDYYKKVPKSLFLIKKAKIGSEVGEPILNIFDRQRRAIINDKKLYSPQ